MGIIEQAARRLEELKRAGVEVPWEAAGFTKAEIDEVAQGRSPEKEPAVPGQSRPVAASPAVPAARSREVHIDLAKLVEEGYLAPGTGRSRLADEFRLLKRPLLKFADGVGQARSRPANLIMVTSAMPNEGKTFCAINLALSIASEVDTSVLLVDADVVRPSIPSRLGLSGTHDGLMELLRKEKVEMSEVLLRTNIPKLSLLPAGTPRADSTELLASGAMERLLNELAQRYADRIIIFDSPPLLITTEAKVLASAMGQIVVVVDEQSSSPRSAAKAFAALEGLPTVYAVLNKSQRGADVPRYGYAPE
jgi:exopolysaccharide/PEP-CTERM locus tyrosine autokinase